MFTIHNHRVWRVRVLSYELHHSIFSQMSIRSFGRSLHTIAEILNLSLPNLNHNQWCSWILNCTNTKSLQTIHAKIIVSGLSLNNNVITDLIRSYGNLKKPACASQVFGKMSTRQLFDKMSGTDLINGSAIDALRLFKGMIQNRIPETPYTMLGILKACAALRNSQLSKMYHAYLLRKGFESHDFVQNSLLTLYAKCDCIEMALQFFNKRNYKTLVSWNAIIAGCVQCGAHDIALEKFSDMLRTGVAPDAFTMSSIFMACEQLEDISSGMTIHGCVIKYSIEMDCQALNCLLSMHAKLGYMDYASKVFDEISGAPDMFVWDAMIGGYVNNGEFYKALELFSILIKENIMPNGLIILRPLQACALMGNLNIGMQLHAYVMSRGFMWDAFVVNSLIDMYAKCARVDFARRIFDRMAEWNQTSWNCMVSGYAKSGDPEHALCLFKKMLISDVERSDVTMISVLSACSLLSVLHHGQCIHGFIVKSGFYSFTSVNNSLVDMYGKCGGLIFARQLFEEMDFKSAVSWTAIIAGYGLHGLTQECFNYFAQMQKENVKPSSITFISLLSACSRAGLVKEAKQLFELMKRDYNIVPQMEHYACMVDILGRTGHLEEALGFIHQMPILAGEIVWGALLGACRIHDNFQIGEYSAKQLFNLAPENTGYHVLLSNLYAAVGDDTVQVR